MNLVAAWNPPTDKIPKGSEALRSKGRISNFADGSWEHASTVSETPRKMTLVEQRVEEMRRQFGPRADGRLDADVREFMVSTADDPLMTR